MKSVAIKMLLGDKAKYFGLIFGVAFASLLMGQQVTIFLGIMARAGSAIYSVSEADIWVMDKRVRYIEEVEPMRSIELSRIRSIKGVEWAVPFYKGLSTIRMPDGLTQQVQLIGVDDASLVGICRNVIDGDKLAITRPQTAMIDKNGFIFTWPKQPLKIGKQIELNDNRLTINAICDVLPTFFTFPIVYVTYRKALEITPQIRKRMPFVLVKAKKGNDLPGLARRIEKQTGLQALTQDEFAWRSIRYLLERTGIPINFGLTILLGLIVGGAITAQTFYIFVVENLRQFATMKAIGVTNRQLLTAVLIQASIIGSTGYFLGMGLTALFVKFTSNTPALKGFVLHWEVLLGVAILMTIIITISILFSLRKVFKLDPAIVFRT